MFTQKELAKYSVTKALSELSNSSQPGYDGAVTGLEQEVHDALASRLKDLTKTLPSGFLLPLACLKALNVTSAPAGGFTVATELAAIEPALRSKSVVVAMGATIFESLRGALGIPAESTTTTAEWLSELEELSASDPVYSQTLLAPKRCASMTTLSRQLMIQNDLGVEIFVRASLLRTIGQTLDKGALSGTGNDEPTGILNASGTGSVTFGGAATRAKAIEFQDKLTTAEAGNTPDARLGYVTSTATASKWMQLPEVATYPSWLWSGNQWQGTVAGLPARSSNNVTGNRVICGDWSKLVVAMWGQGTIQILADPFARKKEALVEFMATLLADIGLVHPSAMTVSSDSGAA
jgi:HK97 family phage major capsid protein